MSKLIVTLLLIGILIVCDGSPLSHESSESNESNAPTKMDFLEKISEQCRNNTGSDDAFLELMESFENVSRCVLKFDIESFNTDFEQLTNATRTAFFTKYCAEVRPLVSCFDDVFDSMTPCIKESGFKVMKVFFDSFPETLDVACKNDGEIIFKLKDETRKNCFMEQGKQLSECVGKYMSSAIWNDDWNSELTQDKCSILTSYRSCLMEPLDACDLSDLISIYDVPMNAMLRLTPCANTTEELRVETHQNNATEVI
ncbi:27 kDa hemolymph protein-like [Anopheles aquasalis]|uniref:27 kDa hemolymph protein-like n=1 Tax=Anopheles aquasalis TaxID=42839 RepID=UPI00215B3D32|nr:27 kDa hemolymph protein-like [Anopheles aquasalis]